MCNLTAQSSHPSLRLLAGFLFLLTFWKQVVALLPSPTLSVRCITRTHSTLITMNKPSTIPTKQTILTSHHSWKFFHLAKLLGKKKSKNKLLNCFSSPNPQTKFIDTDIQYATHTTSYPFKFYNPKPFHNHTLAAKYRHLVGNILDILILPIIQCFHTNIQNFIPIQPLPLRKFNKKALSYINQHCYRVRWWPVVILQPNFYNANHFLKSHGLCPQQRLHTKFSVIISANISSYIPFTLYQLAASIFPLTSRSNHHYSPRLYIYAINVTHCLCSRKKLSLSVAQHRSTTGSLSEVHNNHAANTSTQVFLHGPA